jgi:dimethylargininase
VASPRVASRRGEVDSTAASLDGIGRLAVARIVLPGTLDGGDVLKGGRTAYVGQGLRTNPEGVAQLATLIEPRGWRVVPVPVTKVLHLKSGVTALPDGTVIGYQPLSTIRPSSRRSCQCRRSTAPPSSTSATTW